MNAPITYRPWIPRDGMRPVYDVLCKSLGKVEDWPANVREAVCNRGRAMAFHLDPACATNSYYAVSVDVAPIINYHENFWKARC